MEEPTVGSLDWTCLKSGNQHPMCASGSIEQDADVVIFVYRGEYGARAASRRHRETRRIDNKRRLPMMPAMDGKVLVPSNTSFSSFIWDECVEQKRIFD